jgi:parallel beta-helix repeat protein
MRNKLVICILVLACLNFHGNLEKMSHNDKIDKQINIYNQINNENVPKVKISNNLIPFDPIKIENDSDLIDKANNYGWLGSGTEFDPYEIADYIIDNNSVIGIEINSVSYYTIIRNVVINGSLGNGISISNSQIPRIQDCVISNITSNSGTQNGILIVNSPYSEIKNTTTINNSIGINVQLTTEINIDGNFFYESSRAGIYLPNNASTTNAGIMRNFASNNYIGFEFDAPFGSYLSLLSNRAEYNNIGYQISTYNYLFNNSAIKNTWYGFNFVSLFDSSMVNNTALENGQYGFYFQNCGSINFEYNNASNNKFDGVLLEDSSTINIYYNFFINNTVHGVQIYIGNSNIMLTNNFFSQNSNGIDLYSCLFVLISNNTFYNNINGIRIVSTSYDTIQLNQFNLNSNSGVFIDSSSFNNTVKQNQFINNTLNGKDNSGMPNLWEKNFYHDYTNASYYVISGSTGAIDNFPHPIDLDNDGMPDYFEKLYGFNVLENDSYLDSDGDGFNNYQEFLLGSNPLIAQNFSTSTQIVTDTITETLTNTVSETITNTVTNEPIVYTTTTIINNTLTTIYSNVTTIATFQFKSTSDNTNTLIPTNSIPGFQLLLGGFAIVGLYFFKINKRK